MTAPQPPALVEPLTVERLAEDLNLDVARLTEAQKGELYRHLRSAIRHAEKKCGPILPRTKTMTVNLYRGSGLLPVWPVVSIDSAVDPNGAAVTLTVDDAGIATSDTCSTWQVTVTATVGYDPIPEDLATGVLIVAAHMYAVGERRPGQGEGRPPGFGGGAPSAPSPGYAIPNRAATLIAPYEWAVIS